MASNVQLLLGGILADERITLVPSNDRIDFFELFTASKLLQPYDLGIDELEAGLIGGGNDGGIDGFYTLIDGEPLEDGSLMVKREVNVELILFQSKDSPSFSGTALDKLISTINTAFDLGRNLADLRKLYNERFIERAQAFRQFYSSNIARIAKLSVRIYYVSRSEHTHDALIAQASTLQASAERLFPNCSYEFGFIGAPELLKIARTQRPEWIELKIAEGPLIAGNNGYVGLVKLPDYATFITDEHGNRRRMLFLDNVRDYEGKAGVNTAIARTLRGESPEDFWTLNNGVTLLAQQVRPSYKALALRDPKIVNGLQTSVEIFDHFKAGICDDNRTVLVRVVVPADEASRDRIIVATNQQTPIAPGVLKATDPIHKDIEEAFARDRLYYERRRNSYRNEGIGLDEIVTIPQLARAVTSILLQEPHIAVKVNAPKLLLTRSGMYDRIFSREYPLQAYVTCAKVVKYVESEVGKQPDTDDGDEVYLGQGRRPRLWWIYWHLAMYITARAVGSEVTPQKLAALDFDEIRQINISDAVEKVRGVMQELRKTQGRTEYQMSKSSKSTVGVLALLHQTSTRA